ncbi:GNAT family N-acetyltransferase [Plantactinospora sp. WMMB334]|uniref:GNAT family N-acetyltransferase n=1 Tax=unclassified Plantactinospora TaxID=2631981 RepID=UPI003B9519A0
MSPSPRLERITPENVVAACQLRVRPDQEGIVAPVAQSLAEAYAQPDVAWPRLIYDGDRLVGFVMAFLLVRLDPADQPRSGLWRLTVAAGEQGRGYGRFAVEAVCAELRRRGEKRAFVAWIPGEHGPERFYRRLGFRLTGEQLDGEVVGALDLT